MAPRTRVMFQILRRFNPTTALLEMKGFVARHEYIFTLLLQLNVNMGSFDVSRDAMRESLCAMRRPLREIDLDESNLLHCWKGRRALENLGKLGGMQAAYCLADLLLELGEAVRTQGLHFGFYYSLMQWDRLYTDDTGTEQARNDSGYVADVMIPDLKDKKLLQSLLEAIKRIKILSKRK